MRERRRQCCGSGSGIRCFFDPWTRIRKRFFLDPGSQIHIFDSLVTNFSGKKFYNSLKTGPNFFLQNFKNKIIFNFLKFVATKKGFTTNFFSPFSLVAVFGSGIRGPRSGIWDPGSRMGKNQDSGSGINIPDPQHWKKAMTKLRR
jgi:hypothetical protein